MNLKSGDLITDRQGLIRMVVDIREFNFTHSLTSVVLVLDSDGELQSYSKRYLEEFTWKVGGSEGR